MLLPPAVMAVQAGWSILGRNAPILQFFLLISCPNICTAAPVGESPVPCKILQLLPQRRLRQICGRQEILFVAKSFVGFSLKALMPSENSKSQIPLSVGANLEEISRRQRGVAGFLPV